uniref:Cyclic nucleotide-gated cation channel alpha-3 n=1 Tax=Schistosoma haematobium TaxID=6185 RepID=A0A094ZI25_SCHHA
MSNFLSRDLSTNQNTTYTILALCQTNDVRQFCSAHCLRKISIFSLNDMIVDKWDGVSNLKDLVIDSSESGYYYWIGIVTITVLYNAIVLPMRSAFTQFHELSPIIWMVLDYCIDCVYFMDIFVGLRTEEGLLVRDKEKLKQAYIKRQQFIIDIMAILPTDLFYFIPVLNHYASWLRFNRLMKIYRSFEFVDRTETRTNRPNLFRLSSDSFVYPPRSSDDTSDEYKNYTEQWDRLFSQYVYSFYWSTLILTTIGETPKPVRNAEYIFITIDFLVGVLIFATVVGNVGAMITNMNAARTEFQNKMDGVKRYMEFRKVNKELELRVIRWFDYLWTNKQSLEEDSLNALPDKLKAEIAIHVHFDTLKRVSIFKTTLHHKIENNNYTRSSQKVAVIVGYVELVLKLQLQVFSPGDYICRKGDIGKEMYIVKRGKLSVVSEDGKTVFVTLGEGSVFGEISILNIAGNKTGNRRSANVRSVGYSDLFCLSKDDLWDALTEYPETKTILMQRGQDILRKDNLLDEDVLRKAQEQQESIEQCVQRIDGTVNQLTTRLARLIGEFGASQAKLKRRLARLEQEYDMNSSFLVQDNNNNIPKYRKYSEQLTNDRQLQSNTQLEYNRKSIQTIKQGSKLKINQKQHNISNSSSTSLYDKRESLILGQPLPCDLDKLSLKETDYLQIIFDIPGSVLTDEDTFDYELIDGDIHVTLEKSKPGLFKDLDLITKLLITSSETKPSKCLIEELNDTVEQQKCWSLDWFGDSKSISSTPEDVVLSNPTYGFSGSKSGLFQVESDLTHAVDLPHPDSVDVFKRSELRKVDEEKKFLVDHYLADYFESDSWIHMKNIDLPWSINNNTNSLPEFSSDERHRLITLSTRRLPLQPDNALEEKMIYLGLLDLLFAYIYDYRVREGETMSESGWNIVKLAATLSWFEVYHSLPEVVVSFYRRALTYPLVRSWRFCTLIKRDASYLLQHTNTKQWCLKCLLEIREFLIAYPGYHVFAELYLNDYIVWIQTRACESNLHDLGKSLEEFKMKKDFVDLNLKQIEQLGHECLKMEKLQDSLKQMSFSVNNIEDEKPKPLQT